MRRLWISVKEEYIIIYGKLGHGYNCDFSIIFFYFIKNTSILLLWSIY